MEPRFIRSKLDHRRCTVLHTDWDYPASDGGFNGGRKRPVWLEHVFFNVGGMVDMMRRQFCLAVLFSSFYGRPKAVQAFLTLRYLQRLMFHIHLHHYVTVEGPLTSTVFELQAG